MDERHYMGPTETEWVSFVFGVLAGLDIAVVIWGLSGIVR